MRSRMGFFFKLILRHIGVLVRMVQQRMEDLDKAIGMGCKHKWRGWPWIGTRTTFHSIMARLILEDSRSNSYL